MFIGQIVIAADGVPDNDAALDAINTLLAALRMNGQVCGNEWPVAITSSGYMATVPIPGRDSIDPAHHNKYVLSALQKMREAGLSEPECKVAESMDGADICACDRVPSYVLYTNYLSLEPPLRCGGCFLPVPLYRIPPTQDAEYNDIIWWQSYYQACDTLQMNCTPLERTAMRQLYRPDSGLSASGLGICRRVFELTGTPTFYYLYRYGARSLRQELKRLCPSCEGEWLLPAAWHLFDFKCDRCRLVSNIAWDVRYPRPFDIQGKERFLTDHST